MTTRWDRLPHTVYQYFSRDGELLYVGCTSNLTRRERQHHSKPWWPAVARRETETFVSRFAGLTAEQALIEYHQPTHNIYRKVHQSDVHRFQLDMAIARDPMRINVLIAEDNYRRRDEIAAEREAAIAEQVMWKRVKRRLRESKFRAAYLADMREKHARRQLSRAS